MTAPYGFLLAVRDPDAPDDEVLADAVSVFENEYFNQYCTEDDAYEVVSVVLGTGRHVGADVAAPSGWGSTPAEALEHAAKWNHTVAIDAGLFGASDLVMSNDQARALRQLAPDAVAQMTRSYLAAAVADAYAALVADVVEPAGFTDALYGPGFDPEALNRRKAADYLEKFLASRIAPFTTALDRPRYRAFDVRPFGQTTPELQPHHGVLTVAIRT